MTFVKICGITNLDDALVAVEAGADALGFNFYEKSPRYVAPGSARHIIDKLPKEVVKVGVFVNENVDRLIDIVHTSLINSIQLHGNEDPEFAETLYSWLGFPVIKAFGVSSDFSREAFLNYKVDAVLLDAFSSIEYGGTGKTFDWEIAKAVRAAFPKMYLAGGLSANNVKQAIEAVEPYAVDASSRLESSPGKKDAAKVRAFIAAAKEHE